jgi:hypothetical protein
MEVGIAALNDSMAHGWGVALRGGDELRQAEPRLGADVPRRLARRCLRRPHLPAK